MLKNIFCSAIAGFCLMAAFPFQARSEEVMGVAETLFLKQQYWQAVEAFQDIIKENPDNPELDARANYLTGACYVNLFDFLTAKKNFEAVIGKYNQSPYYEDAFLALGDVEFLQENFQEALKIYEDFLATTPSKKRLATLYFRLAELNLRLGYKDAFKKYLNKLNQEFPDSFEAKDARRLSEADSFYTVQVGAFTDYDNAQKFIARLESKGFKVQSVLCMLSGKKLCRVRVGQYRTMEEAKVIKKNLESQGYFAKILPQ